MASMRSTFVRVFSTTKATIAYDYPFGPFWYFTFALMAVNLLWVFLAANITLHSSWYMFCLAYLGASLFAAIGFRALNHAPIAVIFHRILCMIATFAVGKMTYLQLRTHNYLSMSLSGEWTDPILAQWDVAIGFSWWSYVNWLLAHPTILNVIDLAYSSVDWPIAGVAVLLIAAGLQKQVREFFGLIFITAFVCMWIAIFFPAQGAIAYYEFSKVHSTFEPVPAIYHIKKILTLQSDALTYLRPNSLQGLATFPSFHTALGVLIIYAARPRFYLLLPATLYSVAMIAATPFFGGHYIIDIISGAVLTVIIIALWRMFIEPRLRTAPEQKSLWLLAKAAWQASDNV